MFEFFKKFFAQDSQTASRRLPSPRAVRPSVELLERRDLMAALASISGTTLTVTGTDSADTVLIRDYGNAVDPIDIDLGDGLGWRYVPRNITDINLQMYGGDDFVQYELWDDLQAHAHRSVYAHLGYGNDVFLAYLDDWTTGSDLLSGSSLTLNVDGFFGRDYLMVDAHLDVDVHQGASLEIDLNGGKDADDLFVNYHGELDGTLFLDVYGSYGNDSVSASLTFDAGSWGLLTGRGGNPARVHGANGDDKMYFSIWDHGWVNKSYLFHGGLGNDVGCWSDNILATSISEDDCVGSIVIA